MHELNVVSDLFYTGNDFTYIFACVLISECEEHVCTYLGRLFQSLMASFLHVFWVITLFPVSTNLPLVHALVVAISDTSFHVNLKPIFSIFHVTIYK